MSRIKTAVVGTGYLGRLHAEKYSQIPEAELVAVVDVDRDRAEEVASKNSTRALTDYTELFDRVDAVSIVTPTETHREIGMDFLKRGVDVLIEKPIAVDTAEAGDLVKAAEATGAVLQVGHLERFNAAVVALNGRVNNPTFIESYRLAPFPNRGTDVDVILDLMIHDIDIILNLIKHPVKEIDAVGVPVISHKVDIANARLKFENGCVANVTASRVSREKVRKVNLFQADACISIDYAHQNIAISKLFPGTDGGFSSMVDEELKIEKTDSLLEEIKAFIDCSLTKRPPLVSGVDGKRALEVAQRIQDSVRVTTAEFMA